MVLEDAEDGDDAFSYKDFVWNRRKITVLQHALLRYGWGRWKSFLEAFETPIDLSYMKAACHVFIKCYINTLDEKNPVLEHIYSSGFSKDMVKYENKFYKSNRGVLDTIVSTGGTSKTNRLTTLFIINLVISSCKNPPDDLAIPDTNAQKPSEWWTQDDDRALLYGVWKYGFQHYSDITFSHRDDPPLSSTVLNARLKALVNGLKPMLAQLCKNTGFEMDISQAALHEIRSQWSRKEHQIVQRTLCMYGFPDAEDFVKKAGLTSKTPEMAEKYVDSLLKYCTDLQEASIEAPDKEIPPTKMPKLGILAEALTLGQAHRIRMRTDIFQKARDLLNNKERKLRDDDRRILELFCQNGFYDLSDNEEIVKYFGGADALDGKLSKKIQQLVRNEIPRSSSSGGPLTVRGSIVKFQRDDDGNPVFPILASTSLRILSLGKVVFDRPGFHNERYLYPDGYATERLYQSCLNVEQKVWYRSEIIDDGQEQPLFRVTIPGTDVEFTGTSPSKPWLGVIKAIEDRKKEEGLVANRSLTISGPDCYGLTSPLVAMLMRDMPNADKCSRYNKPKVEATEIDQIDDMEEERSDVTKRSKSKQIKPRPPPTTTMTTRHSAHAKVQQTSELKFDFSKLIESKVEIQVSNLQIDTENIIQKNSLSFVLDPKATDKTKNAVDVLEASV